MAMNILITGGRGFIGTALAKELLARGHFRGQSISRITLVDLNETGDTDGRLVSIEGDLLVLCSRGELPPADVVFHLAAAVSAECEANFDLGMRSNIDTTRALLETLRATPKRSTFIFASSVAVFGSEIVIPMPRVITDSTLPVPQSSYGIQKYVCEQLIADYTRKEFVDGRSVRMMTVAVRPGLPNGAASSFLSGMLREPLRGEPSVCPVPHEMEVIISSPARTIEGLIGVGEAPADQLGGRTAINLPGLTVTVGEMLQTLAQVGGQSARDLVNDVPDANIRRIVGGWPARFEAARARSLGLAPDPDFRSVVEQFLSFDKGSGR
jgi:D-erythronate 2-dehydrogenase